MLATFQQIQMGGGKSKAAIPQEINVNAMPIPMDQSAAEEIARQQAEENSQVVANNISVGAGNLELAQFSGVITN